LYQSLERALNKLEKVRINESKVKSQLETLKFKIEKETDKEFNKRRVKNGNKFNKEIGIVKKKFSKKKIIQANKCIKMKDNQY
jgi:hypothetical protein